MPVSFMETDKKTPVSPKRWLAAGLASLLVACTLALFGPAQIFLTNSIEFHFDFIHLLPQLGLIAACLFLPLAVLLGLLPRRFRLHERGVAVVLVLGILLWLQGNLLLWQYGALSGQEIDWGRRALYGLIDSPLWIAGLLLALWRPGFFHRRTKGIAASLLLIQLISAAFTVIRQPAAPSFKKLQVDHTQDFAYSGRRNVIVLILDSFQSDIFQEIIDRDPAYRDIFRGFTYFRNTTGGFPSTYASVPLILTGQFYANSEPIQNFISRAYRSDSSVPLQLSRRGWQVNLAPAVQSTILFDPQVLSNIEPREQRVEASRLAWLYDLTLFRYLPHLGKRAVHHEGKWFLSRWMPGDALDNLLGNDDPQRDSRPSARLKRRTRRAHTRIGRETRRLGLVQLRKTKAVNSDSRFVSSFLMQAAVMSDDDVFKFYHWRGPHEPICMNAELEKVSLPLSRDNLVSLARGELKLVDIFLTGLRELGIYDRSLIFIMADHGHSQGAIGLRLPADLPQAGSQDGSPLIRVMASGSPLLLVKRPGDSGELRISDAPASHVDVSATIFRELGLEPRGSGMPLFQIQPGQRRERSFFHYTWEHRDWMNLYLPDLTEYRILGHAWLASSWLATGKVLKPGR